MDRMSRALLFSDNKPRYAFGFVHVDDCAAVHVNALDSDLLPTSLLTSSKEEEGVDWLVAASSTPPSPSVSGEQLWLETAQTLKHAFEDEVQRGVFEIGFDMVPVNMPFRVDGRRTEGLVLGGRRMRGLVECVGEVGCWYSKLARVEGGKKTCKEEGMDG